MSRSRAWAELLRLPAPFTVPGDALSGAVAVVAVGTGTGGGTGTGTGTGTDAVRTAPAPARRRLRHPRHLPLQAALAARAGSGLTAATVAAHAPTGRTSAKKVNIT